MKCQLLIVVLLGLSLGTAGALAVATDISGIWVCSIDRASEKGYVTVSGTTEQFLNPKHLRVGHVASFNKRLGSRN